MMLEQVDGTWVCAKHKAMGGGSVCPSCVVEIVKAERAALAQVIIKSLRNLAVILDEEAVQWAAKYEGRRHGD